MTRSTPRRAVARTLAAAVAAATLAACAGTGAGVAARVGSARITNDALAGIVDRGYVGPVTRQAERVDMQRAWLTQLVKAELYREAARRLGVLPSQAELARIVDTQIRAQGGQAAVESQYAANGVAPRDVRAVLETATLSELVSDALVKDIQKTDAELRAEYARRLIEFDQAHIAHIRVKDKAKADQLAAQVRGGGDFALLARQSEDAQTAATGGDLGVIGNGPGRFDRAIVSAVFKARTGDVLGPIRVADGYEIVRVVERVTVPFEEARDSLRRSLTNDEREKRRKAYERTVLDDLGLSVSPRYGRWDDEAFRVTEGGDGLSSPAASPGVQAPGGP